jgi:hypothetical protein
MHGDGTNQEGGVRIEFVPCIVRRYAILAIGVSPRLLDRAGGETVYSHPEGGVLSPGRTGSLYRRNDPGPFHACHGTGRPGHGVAAPVGALIAPERVPRRNEFLRTANSRCGRNRCQGRSGEHDRVEEQRNGYARQIRKQKESRFITFRKYKTVFLHVRTMSRNRCPELDFRTGQPPIPT